MSAPRGARIAPDTSTLARRSRAAVEASRRRRTGEVARQEGAVRRRRLVVLLVLLGAAGSAFVAGVISGGTGGTSLDYKTATASTYATYGEELACGGSLEPGTIGVAHKTLPCGTKLSLKHGNDQLNVTVIDRGPYVRGRELDLTQSTANELHFNGLGPIQWAKR
jgi:rare lipoprotein A